VGRIPLVEQSQKIERISKDDTHSYERFGVPCR